MTKRITIAIAIFAIIGGLVVFFVTLTRALWYAPEDTNFFIPTFFHKHVAAPTPSVTPTAWPVRLRIPSLKIDANVQAVGVGKSGNLAVPTNYTDAAWYKGGTLPGKVGDAVFDGHVDNGFGMDGVFRHLGDITEGDEIWVTTKGGTTYTYVVRSLKEYPYDAVPMQEIFTGDDTARLTIITCEGDWISGKKTYDHRLVVSAVLWSDN